MRTIKRILFQLFIIAFISFSLGNDIFNYCIYGFCKIENAATGSNNVFASETPAEEDIPVITSHFAAQDLNTDVNNLRMTGCVLPTLLYFSIWLPPDKS